jgi:serine/threonine protein kinase
MHSKEYIHSDIKPGYLSLNPVTGTMALIDLECTIKIGEVICGMSKEYASPEQKEMIRLLRHLSDREDEKSVLKKVQLNTASDRYSVGLLSYQVMTGRLWQKSPISPKEINKSMPDKLNKVILGLLEENPDDHIKTAEALKCELETI